MEFSTFDSTTVSQLVFAIQLKKEPLKVTSKYFGNDSKFSKLMKLKVFFSSQWAKPQKVIKL